MVIDLRLRALAEKEKRNRERGRPSSNGAKPPPMPFREFIHKVNPKYQYYAHVDRLIDVLQRVADGEITRLMVFMPPRHGKSETLSRLFSAYYLYRFPERWVGLNSYADALATTLSRSARDNYRRVGGKMNEAAQSVHHWETSARGGMWAAGVGGPITGKGFHLGIIDDPLKNAEDADSETIREKQVDWYLSTFSTREEPGGAVVVMLTRWHENDLAGWLLAKEKEADEEPERWHIVSFPAIALDVPQVWPESCTYEPEYRQSGEPLCKERYPLTRLEKIRSRLKGAERFWWALFQQRPISTEGGIFQKSWYAEDHNRYHLDNEPIRNKVVARWITLDTALKDKATNDPSAACVWELWPDYRLAVRSMWQGRILGALLPTKIEDLARQWNYDSKLRGVVIEDKGSGTTSIQTLRMTAPAWLANLIIEYQPSGTKEYRAKLFSVWCERGCVQLPHPCDDNAEWYTHFLDPDNGQLWVFPNAAHDDMVDTFTMGLYLEHYLAQGWQARGGG